MWVERRDSRREATSSGPGSAAMSVFDELLIVQPGVYVGRFATQRGRASLKHLETVGKQNCMAVIDLSPVSIRAPGTGRTNEAHRLPAIPGLQIAPRPVDTMLAPFEMADPTIVSSSFVLE